MIKIINGIVQQVETHKNIINRRIQSAITLNLIKKKLKCPSYLKVTAPFFGNFRRETDYIKIKFL